MPEPGGDGGLVRAKEYIDVGAEEWQRLGAVDVALAEPSASGDTQLVAALAGHIIRVHGYSIVVEGATDVRIRDNAGTPNNISPIFPGQAAGEGIVAIPYPGFVGDTASGQALDVNNGSAVQIRVWVMYSRRPG